MVIAVPFLAACVPRVGWLPDLMCCIVLTHARNDGSQPGACGRDVRGPRRTTIRSGECPTGITGCVDGDDLSVRGGERDLKRNLVAGDHRDGTKREPRISGRSSIRSRNEYIVNSNAQMSGYRRIGVYLYERAIQ